MCFNHWPLMIVLLCQCQIVLLCLYSKPAIRHTINNRSIFIWLSEKSCVCWQTKIKNHHKKIRCVCSASAFLLFWLCFYVQARVQILHISQKEKCICCHREQESKFFWCGSEMCAVGKEKIQKIKCECSRGGNA